MADKDILVVVSKLKAYIKDKADMNTSGAVAEALSEIVKKHTDSAIEAAKKSGRKTVMDRDFEGGCCDKSHHHHQF